MEESKLTSILHYLSNNEAEQLISKVIEKDKRFSKLSGFRPTWAESALLNLRYKLYDFLEEEELYFSDEEEANRHFVHTLIRAGYLTFEELKKILAIPAMG